MSGNVQGVPFRYALADRIARFSRLDIVYQRHYADFCD
jgi:acylphosphatase